MKRRCRDLKPGEWIQPKRKGYRLACCFCGLVHRIDFRLVPSLNGWIIQMRFNHDHRATAAVRREKKKRRKRVKLFERPATDPPNATAKQRKISAGIL